MQSPPQDRPEPVDPMEPRAPDGWVWLAGAMIVIMGAYGLYRGVTSVQSGQAPLLAPAGVTAPVDAVSAAPMAPDGQWSTLSGPKVLPPPPPKAVPPSSAPDASEADSSAADDQSAAAEAAPPQDATQPPPASPPGAVNPPVSPEPGTY